MYLFVTCCPLC